MSALSLVEAEGPMLSLPETLDLTAVDSLTASLRSMRGRPLAIDASRVRKLGGLCLQVLLSARATWVSDGLAIVFVKGSPEFNEACALMGATSLMQMRE